MSHEKIKKILVLGDWDADGVVAAALIKYSQEYAKKYPLEESAVVDQIPVDSEKLKYLLSHVKNYYHTVVLLDVPYNDILANIAKILRKHFNVSKIYFIDHHIASIQKTSELNNVFDEVLVDHKKPTSAILYDELAKRGVNVHSRLREFVEVIKYMDAGKKIPSRLIKLFELAKMISKALTAVRNEELWIKTVNWLADPTPTPIPINDSVFSMVSKVVEERDKEIKEVAMRLAVTAVKVGDFRVIDARNAWKKRGTTALASKLSAILKAPVAMIASTNRGYSLLIVKAPGGRAYRVAKYLLAEGIALDIAGHPNLAIVRISKNTEIKKLVEVLHQAIYYVS